MLGTSDKVKMARASGLTRARRNQIIKRGTERVNDYNKGERKKNGTKETKKSRRKERTNKKGSK